MEPYFVVKKMARGLLLLLIKLTIFVNVTYSYCRVPLSLSLSLLLIPHLFYYIDQRIAVFFVVAS